MFILFSQFANNYNESICMEIYLVHLFISRLIQATVSTRDMSQVKQVIALLTEYCYSQNTPVKRGGIIGMAAVSAGLGNQVCVISYFPYICCFCSSNGRYRFLGFSSTIKILIVHFIKF